MLWRVDAGEGFEISVELMIGGKEAFVDDAFGV